MSEGPIPWTAIQKYAEAEGLVGDAFRRFKSIIRAIDNEYLRVKSDQAERAARQKERDDEDDAADRALAKAKAQITRSRKAVKD